MPVPAPTTFETIQQYMAVGEFLTMDEDFVLLNVPQIVLAPPTCYDCLSGLDFAPGASAAMLRWLNNRTAGAIVAGVAAHAWPGPGVGETDRTSIFEFTAGAADTAGVQIAVPTMTDAQLLAASGSRTFELTFYTLNNAAHILPISLQGIGAGRVPLRYMPGSANLNMAHGDLLRVRITFVANSIGYVTLTPMGKPLVPLWRMLANSRATSATTVTISSGNFNPFLTDGDPMILFTSRNAGTARTLPAGRGWVDATGTGLTAGGVANGVGGSKLAISTTRGGSPANFDVGGTLSNQNHAAALAFIGLDVHEARGSFSSGTDVAWHAYTGIPKGGFVVFFTAANQATGVVPTGGEPVHTSDGTSQGGYTYRCRIVYPDANGDVAPPNNTLAAAVTVDQLSVCFWPRA